MGKKPHLSSGMPPLDYRSSGKRVMICNLAVDMPQCLRGSLAYVLQIGWRRVRVLIRSSRGRWVSVWAPIGRLGNFRFETLDLQDPLLSERAIPGRFDDDDLSDVASAGAGQDLDFRTPDQGG